MRERADMGAGRPLLATADLRAALVAEIASFLGAAPELIEDHAPLTDYGIDSADLVALMCNVEERLGARLPVAAFVEVSTLTELIEKISAALQADAAEDVRRDG
jgi:acyl carrier protein